jgi:hypothetical protein
MKCGSLDVSQLYAPPRPLEAQLFLYLFLSYFRCSRKELTHGAEPFLRSRQFCSHLRTSQHFMELEDSLSYSQEPSLGSYLEPHQSNQHHPILSVQDPFLILSTHLRLGLPCGLFPSGFPTNILYASLFSSIRATCPAHP